MNMNLVNKIAFNKLSAFVASVPVEVQSGAFSHKAITFVSEMQNFGFLVSKELYQYLSSLEEDMAVAAYKELLALVKDNVGRKVYSKAFYPNFPKQVMELSEAEIYFNNVWHFWTKGAWTSGDPEEKRAELKEENTLTEIGLVSMEEMKAYFFKLLASKNSLPESLVEFVDLGINEGWVTEYEGEVPFKETLCRVATKLIKQGKSVNGVISTTTDVLRVMASLSESDIELKNKVKFKSQSRKTRRLLVSALEDVINISDVKAYSALWKRAFHSLHVGEFGGKVAEIATRFRNEKNVVTSETVVAEAIKSGDVKKAVEKLLNKPPVFARSLDKLLRDADTSTANWVIAQFASVADKVDSKVLLQLLGHFKGRALNENGSRVVFTAGSKGKALLAQSLVKMDKNLVTSAVAVVRQAIEKQFAEKALLAGKKVFITPEVYSVLLPSQLASVSEDKKTVARGSRIPFDVHASDAEKNTLRMFIHWIGKDQDLSAFFISEDFKRFDQIAFYNLREDMAVHSGDIRHAPAPLGASEFIDIDIAKALNKGQRYLAMDVRVFSGESFVDHEQSFAGFMLRKDPQSGEIFEPSTVKSKFDLTANGKSVVPCFFDLKNREVIWMDTVLPGKSYGEDFVASNSLANNVATVSDMLEAYQKMADTKLTVRDLVKLHANAVGAEIVFERQSADFVVGLGEGDLDVYDFVEINKDWI